MAHKAKPRLIWHSEPRSLGDALLNFRLNRHDKNQLELKLAYGLRPHAKRQRYRVETYVFVPRVLALTRHSYTASRFYADTATFIRMTTPKVALSALSSKSAVRPWASDIKAQIDRFAAGEPGDVKAAEQGLKLLACVFKGAVRDAHFDVQEAIKFAIADTNPSGASEQLTAFTVDLESALTRLHKVGERAEQDGVPIALREGWRAIDEYVSLLAEEALTALVAQCADQPGHEQIESATNKARLMAVGQYRHRRKQGYQSYANEGDRNEHLPHRWRVLKRYVSSALYLSVRRDKTGQMAMDFIGMAAAAFAMLFATVALLVIQELWAASLSSAFLTAMVLAYVIKDRIKELGKRRLGRRLKGIMADHRVHIYGADGAEVGQAEESFQVRRPEKIPPEILDCRCSDLDTHEAVNGRPETVLCYDKKIVLSSDGLKAQFAGATGLTDIIRLNLQPAMARMDDAWETYRYIHPRTHVMQQTQCARVYHINVVVRLIAQDSTSSIHRVRAVVNRKGIIRVEAVTGALSRQDTAQAPANEAANIQIFDE